MRGESIAFSSFVCKSMKKSLKNSSSSSFNFWQRVYKNYIISNLIFVIKKKNVSGSKKLGVVKQDPYTCKAKTYVGTLAYIDGSQGVCS